MRKASLVVATALACVYLLNIDFRGGLRLPAFTMSDGHRTYRLCTQPVQDVLAIPPRSRQPTYEASVRCIISRKRYRVMQDRRPQRRC